MTPPSGSWTQAGPALALRMAFTRCPLACLIAWSVLAVPWPAPAQPVTHQAPGALAPQPARVGPRPDDARGHLEGGVPTGERPANPRSWAPRHLLYGLDWSRVRRELMPP